jgi:hypothetical protein
VFTGHSVSRFVPGSENTGMSRISDKCYWFKVALY